MSASNWSGLERSIEFIRSVGPKSVLDIGVGFGKWGFLCRLYLDAYHFRVAKPDWKIRIEGVEAFPAYLDTQQRHIYDRLYKTDILSAEPYLMDEYGLAIAGDVLEHIEKDAAASLVGRLRRRCKALLFLIPVGPGWLRGGTKDNPLEAHVSEWDRDDLAWMDYEEFVSPNGKPQGLFMWRR